MCFNGVSDLRFIYLLILIKLFTLKARGSMFISGQCHFYRQNCRHEANQQGKTFWKNKLKMGRCFNCPEMKLSCVK